MSELRKLRKDRIDAYRSERLELMASAAESALKSAFLVNGGGAVALLAYFGQAARQTLPLPASSGLALALLVLVIGTAFAGIATGLSFLAQYGYYVRRKRTLIARLARSITAFNILLVACSYVCFVGGGIIAFVALASIGR